MAIVSEGRLELGDVRRVEDLRNVREVAEQLAGRRGPVIASTDYLRAVPDQIRQWVSAPYRVLGTDGYGRSDFRAALRRSMSLVVLSNYATADMRRKCLDLGADRVFDKSNEIDALINQNTVAGPRYAAAMQRTIDTEEFA